MSEVKQNLVYSKEHEWAEAVDSRTIRVGITEFAAGKLGDIVFVELPELQAVIQEGDAIGTIESVKTVSELYSPIGGVIVKINEALIDSPETVNEDAYGAGWMVEIQVEDAASALSELMSPEAYRALIAEEE